MYVCKCMYVVPLCNLLTSMCDFVPRDWNYIQLGRTKNN